MKKITHQCFYMMILEINIYHLTKIIVKEIKTKNILFLKKKIKLVNEKTEEDIIVEKEDSFNLVNLKGKILKKKDIIL